MGSPLYSDVAAVLPSEQFDMLETLQTHIHLLYPEYVLYIAKSSGEYTLSFRRGTKTARPICTIYAGSDRFAIRFVFLTSMLEEFLFTQQNFSSKMRQELLSQCICSVAKQCRGYGGNTLCPYRQHFWVENRLLKACPYPWITFEAIHADDMADILRLADMETRHMSQNPKEIKGGHYEIENINRCGNVELVWLEQAELKGQDPSIQNAIQDTKWFAKYASLYGLIPLGANDGLWFRKDSAFNGSRAPIQDSYTNPRISSGLYAFATIEEPRDFSLNRCWNHLCKWILKQDRAIQAMEYADGNKGVCFVKFRFNKPKWVATMHVPLQSDAPYKPK